MCQDGGEVDHDIGWKSTRCSEKKYVSKLNEEVWGFMDVSKVRSG